MGCVVDGHAAHALLVEADLRVADLQRAGIELRAGTVNLCHALVLPWIAGRAATGAEDEAARTIDLHALQRLDHTARHLIVVRAEVVVGEDVVDIHRLLIAGGKPCTIDIHVQVAQRVEGNGEVLRTVVRPGLRVGTNCGVGSHGEQCPLEQLTAECNK